MKTQLMDTLDLGKLVDLVANTPNTNKQYQKELIGYLDKLHDRIRTLEMYMEQFNDISKKFI